MVHLAGMRLGQVDDDVTVRLEVHREPVHVAQRRSVYPATVESERGTVAGIAAVLLLPDGGDTGAFLSGIGFAGWGWIGPVLVPPLAALVAFTATRAAANRVLEDQG